MKTQRKEMEKGNMKNSSSLGSSFGLKAQVVPAVQPTVPEVLTHTSVNHLTRHPRFADAKAGDPHAALAAVHDLVKPRLIQSLACSPTLASAIIVPVLAMEMANAA